MKRGRLNMENILNFKTYEEFVKDEKNEIIEEELDNKEKLYIYNKYCQNNNDCDSMLHKNNDEFLKTVFSTNDKLIDFTIEYMEYTEAELKDLYNHYVRKIIEDAKDSMPLEKFLNTLKKYTTKEMRKKYPIVYKNVYYGYVYYVIDETNDPADETTGAKLKVKGLNGLKYLKGFNTKEN